MNKILLVIIFIILAYVLLNCLNKNIIHERFTNLSPGILPNSEKSGILDNFYKWSDPKTLSNFNYARQSLAYPIYPAKSSVNNNLKFWPTPPNGSCIFPELCNNFYDVLNCNQQEQNHNDTVSNGSICNSPRVNLWCSSYE